MWILGGTQEGIILELDAAIAWAWLLFCVSLVDMLGVHASHHSLVLVLQFLFAILDRLLHHFLEVSHKWPPPSDCLLNGRIPGIQQIPVFWTARVHSFWGWWRTSLSSAVGRFKVWYMPEALHQTGSCGYKCTAGILHVGATVLWQGNCMVELSFRLHGAVAGKLHSRTGLWCARAPWFTTVHSEAT